MRSFKGVSWRARRRQAEAQGKRAGRKGPIQAGRRREPRDVRAGQNLVGGWTLATMNRSELRARRRAGLDSARYQKRAIRAAHREWADNRRAM